MSTKEAELLLRGVFHFFTLCVKVSDKAACLSIFYFLQCLKDVSFEGFLNLVFFSRSKT